MINAVSGVGWSLNWMNEWNAPYFLALLSLQSSNQAQYNVKHITLQYMSIFLKNQITSAQRTNVYGYCRCEGRMQRSLKRSLWEKYPCPFPMNQIPSKEIFSWGLKQRNPLHNPLGFWLSHTQFIILLLLKSEF